MVYIQRNITLTLLVGILVFSIHLPDIFMGLYVRDEGRELTLSYLAWHHAIYYSKITVLSHWIAGWWNNLTEPLGVIGSRMGAGLITSSMAAMCFIILRRFMPACLAFIGLLLTAIATDYAYINFLGYRNISSFFLYTALWLIFLSRENKNISQTIYWIFQLLIGLLLGLAAASKYSFIAALVIPFVLALYDTLQRVKSPKQVWIAALIVSLVGFWVWYGIWNLFTYQSDFPSTVADGSAIVDYGLSLLKVYATAIYKSSTISFYLLILLAIVGLGSITELSLRKYFFLSIVLISISYLLFGLPGLICTLVLIGAGNHIKIDWLRWIGYLCAVLVAYRFMGFWYVCGGVLVIFVNEIIGDESVKWKIAVQGLLLFGMAQYLGIKYHHVPLAIGLFIIIARVAYAYLSGKPIDREYILWAILAITAAFITMIGSATVFSNVETALWLLLPLSLFGNVSGINAKFEIDANHSPIRLAMAILLVAMALCSLKVIDERELPKYRLVALCDHPKLSFLLTTPGRAKSTCDTLTQLKKYTTPGDKILVYNHAPIFYYLTKTKPFLHEPWISAITPEMLEVWLWEKEQTREMPVVVLRAIADTRSQKWGDSPTKYRAIGDALKIKNMLDDWCLHNGFNIVWQNRDFQILKR